jgi:predicted O-methyltransferase YrrM
VLTRERMKILAARLMQRWGPINRFSGRLAHLIGTPNLHLIEFHSALVTSSPEDAARGVIAESTDYADEYRRVRERLDGHDAEPRRYPDVYAVGDGTAFLLYTLIRHEKPSLVLEVGVADGRSTQVILSALDANEAGRLVSVDITDEVGGGARGHPRWTLRVHTPGRASVAQLRNLLAEVGPPDLFFHDGSHGYPDQYGGFLAAWERMQPGSVLASDDVDWSFAFIHLVTAVGVKPVVLIDGLRAVGVVRHP